MPINAKRLYKNGDIQTMLISDDPNESEISRAIGGTGMESNTFIAQILDWEIHSLGNELDEILVIGNAPYLDSPIKKRISCDLTDKQLHTLKTNLGVILEGLRRIN